MRFIRKNGRVIPIREESDGAPVKKSAAIGAAAGAIYHGSVELKASKAESLAKNHKTFTNFKQKLQPGDILVLGSTPKHSSGHAFGELSKQLPKSFRKPVNKLARKVGIHRNSIVLSNSSLLTGVGAGEKYHGAVYLGKGKVAHMSTDAGAVIEKLSDVGHKQNITALRFPNASKAEVANAVKFARTAVKKKVPYLDSVGVKSAFSNLVAPIGKKATQSCGPMVCHTLPIRAYVKRSFTLGEHTFAGDFMKTPGIAAIARRDVIKSPFTTVKAVIGKSAKGLKWGLAAGAAAATFKYIQNKRNKKDV